MKLLEVALLLAVLGALAWAALTVLRSGRRWHVATHTRPDGTLVVAVRRGTDERVVRELGRSIEGYDLASELQLAREEASDLAATLNRA